MFHGGGEPGTVELDLGVGVTGLLLAMPGLLVSLLLLEVRFADQMASR